jgi:hypothetical protein
VPVITTVPVPQVLPVPYSNLNVLAVAAPTIVKEKPQTTTRVAATPEPDAAGATRDVVVADEKLIIAD